MRVRVRIRAEFKVKVKVRLRVRDLERGSSPSKTFHSCSDI